MAGKKMSSPITIRQPRRNTISAADGFSSSHDTIAASAPIKIVQNSLPKRGRINTETADTYFSSILTTPSLSKTSRFQGYSMMEQERDRFDQMYKSSKTAGFSVSSSSQTPAKNTELPMQPRKDKTSKATNPIKEKATVSRTRSSSSSTLKSVTYVTAQPSMAQAAMPFSHQHTREQSHGNAPTSSMQPQIFGTIHPSIVKVGILISKHVLNGSNGRCVAMLEAFKDVNTEDCASLQWIIYFYR